MKTHINYQMLSTEEKVIYLFDSLGIQYNTDTNHNPKPMLAHSYKPGKTKLPLYIQPKLDGVRALMIVSSSAIEDSSLTHQQVKFLSRSGKEYDSLVHIAGAVQQFLMNTDDYSFQFTLDGEIYSDELTFQGITSAVKKLKPESAKLCYRVYDIVTENHQSLRLKELREIVKAIDSELITVVETVPISEESDIVKYHDEFVKQGYEGAMVRDPTGKYEQGQRSSGLQKVKLFQEEEFDFVNWTHGQRVEDLIAICRTKDGKEFRAKMMGNIQDKKEMEENTPKDCKVTVKFFEYTDEGLPRFPVAKVVRAYE